MRRILVIVAISATLSGALSGQSGGPASPEELKEIAVRGRALAEYDDAAWHASDAVQAVRPVAETVQLYVARQTARGWTVVWGRFDNAHSRFLISYEATKGANAAEFTVAKAEPPREDAEFFFHAACALETARHDFVANEHPSRPYNWSILPGKAGSWYVYAIPAQQESAILPYGGDLRYSISADGSAILERRQMHRIVLEEHMPAGGGRPQFAFHSHVLSDVPEDSDVFYAMTRRAEQGEWVATRKYTYEVTPGFSLGYLGETKDITQFLDQGDCRGVPAHANLCADASKLARLEALSTLRRLIGAAPSASPLEALALFSNARCKDGQIWLTLTTSLRNVGDENLILLKSTAGNWIQARFAGSRTALVREEYQKLVFAAVDPQHDLHRDESYMLLSPGMKLEQSMEIFLADLDPKDKRAVQFLIFTWLPGQENQAEPIRERFAKLGLLYTEPILTEPMDFALDQQLMDSCGKK